MTNIIPNKEVTSEQRYNFLVEELRAIILEAVRVSREEIIRSKWELGKRIVEEEDRFSNNEYGSKTVIGLAKDLGTSIVGLYKVIQFYKMFPKERFEDALSELPFGNNISWNKIVNNVLPQPREIEEPDVEEINQEDCNHSIVVCKQCGKIFTFEDYLELAVKIKEDLEK